MDFFFFLKSVKWITLIGFTCMLVISHHIIKSGSKSFQVNKNHKSPCMFHVSSVYTIHAICDANIIYTLTSYISLFPLFSRKNQKHDFSLGLINTFFVYKTQKANSKKLMWWRAQKKYNWKRRKTGCVLLFLLLLFYSLSESRIYFFLSPFTFIIFFMNKHSGAWWHGKLDVYVQRCIKCFLMQIDLLRHFSNNNLFHILLPQNHINTNFFGTLYLFLQKKIVFTLLTMRRRLKIAHHKYSKLRVL